MLDVSLANFQVFVWKVIFSCHRYNDGDDSGDDDDFDDNDDDEVNVDGEGEIMMKINHIRIDVA